MTSVATSHSGEESEGYFVAAERHMTVIQRNKNPNTGSGSRLVQRAYMNPSFNTPEEWEVRK